ncbi:hypothetical protein MTO96_050331, partial [Rhipicephalus appendiculatus]
MVVDSPLTLDGLIADEVLEVPAISGKHSVSRSMEPIQSMCWVRRSRKHSSAFAAPGAHRESDSVLVAADST